MGRDFTPKELHLVDVQYGFSKSPLSIVNTDTGEDVVLWDPESECSKKWPNLAYLFEPTQRLYDESLSDKSLALALGTTEKVLTCIMDSKKVTDDISNEFEHTVREWYEGKLDREFFYNNMNNQLLENAIREMAGILSV